MVCTYNVYMYVEENFTKNLEIDQNKMLKLISSLVQTTTSLYTKKEGINPSLFILRNTEFGRRRIAYQKGR